MPTFDTALPTTMVMDEGFITINSSSQYAVLKGPISVDFGQTLQNIDFAGKRAPVALLDRFTFTDCKITGTMMAMSSTTTPVQIPGSTQTGTTTLTVTPKAMSTLFSSGDYQSNVRGVFRRSDGKYVAVTMAKALFRITGMEGADKDSVGIPFTIEARQDLSLSTDTDVVPYTVQILTTL